MSAAPLSLPPFHPGKQYLREPGAGWRYRYLRDVSTPLPDEMAVPNLIFQDRHGRPWMQMLDSYLTIRAGYAWNGNTLAPDTRRNLLASGVHDACYQCSAAAGFPLTREQADLIYLGILRGSGFMFAGMYHCAVRRFGGIFWEVSMGETMEIL